MKNLKLNTPLIEKVIDKLSQPGVRFTMLDNLYIDLAGHVLENAGQDVSEYEGKPKLRIDNSCVALGMDFEEGTKLLMPEGETNIFVPSGFREGKHIETGDIILEHVLLVLKNLLNVGEVDWNVAGFEVIH